MSISSSKVIVHRHIRETVVWWPLSLLYPLLKTAIVPVELYIHAHSRRIGISVIRFHLLCLHFPASSSHNARLLTVPFDRHS